LYLHIVTIIVDTLHRQSWRNHMGWDCDCEKGATLQWLQQVPGLKWSLFIRRGRSLLVSRKQWLGSARHIT